MKRITTLVLLTLSLLLLGGCGNPVVASRPSEGSPTATPPPSPPPLSIYVSAEDNPATHGYGVFALNAADGKVRWHYSIKYGNASTPVLDNGIVYVASNDQHVYALNASDGSPRWHISTAAFPRQPSLFSNTLYETSPNGPLSAFNASDGSVKWQFAKGGDVISAVDGTLYIQAGQVYALDANNGSVRWSYQSPGDSTGLWTASENQVYTVEEHRREGDVADNVLHVLDASSGKEQWSFSPGKTLLSLVGSENGTLYILSQTSTTAIPNTLYALDSSTGTIRWQAQLSDPGSLATFMNGMLFITAQNNAISALNISDGTLLWHSKLAATNPYSVTPRVIAAADEAVCLYNFDNGLVALNLGDGSVQWSYQTQDAIGNASVINGTLYTAATHQDHSDTGDAYALALNTSDGKMLWRYNIGTETGVPSITAG